MEKLMPHFIFLQLKFFFNLYQNPVKRNVMQDLRIHWEHEINICNSQKQRFFLPRTAKAGDQDLTAGVIATILVR